jgi:hypothetical protein
MPQTFINMGCNLSLKLHFLQSSGFLSNIGDVSDEHGDRLDHGISTMEEGYQGELSPALAT